MKFKPYTKIMDASLIGSDTREANFPLGKVPKEWEEVIYENLYEDRRRKILEK